MGAYAAAEKSSLRLAKESGNRGDIRSASVQWVTVAVERGVTERLRLPVDIAPMTDADHVHHQPLIGYSVNDAVIALTYPIGIMGSQFRTTGWARILSQFRDASN